MSFLINVARTVKLELLDATTLAAVQGVQLRLDGPATSRSADSARPATVVFAFSPSQGPVQKLKLSLTFSPTFLASKETPTSLVFAMSVAEAVDQTGSSSSSTGPVAASSTAALRSTIGELWQPVIETWDDRQFVLMSLRSGPVEIRIEKEPARVAQDKVQTAIRTVHLSKTAPPLVERQADSPNESAATIEITERPGLNNSTGQRLWDCAIGLTSFLSLYPAALDPYFALDGLLEEEGPNEEEPAQPPPAKRLCRDVVVSSRLRPRGRLRVVELGAGCALASMVAAKLLSSPSATGGRTAAATVLATDVETTVESTLEENLRANGLLLSSSNISGRSSNATRPHMIESAVLDWGQLSDEQLRVVLGQSQHDRRSSADTDALDFAALTILATDVLYNPESHPLFLSTLLSLLRPTRTIPRDGCLPRRALVVYKRRTEGDDGFFPLAREAGLEVDKVWEWGEVGVWAVT